jgi:hypothetical protein
MSMVKPDDDSRSKTDKPSHKQSDEPWKGPVEKEQQPNSDSKIDLEKWHSSNTH